MKTLHILFIFIFIQISSFAAEQLIISGNENPPFLFKERGEITGIDAQIIRYIFDELNIEYKFILLPRQRVLRQLESGSIDLAIGFPKDNSYPTHFHFPETFTRNAEYVIFTNYSTRNSHEVSDLNYLVENKFHVGILRGEPYHKRFWDCFPYSDKRSPKHHPLLESATTLEQNLRKLSTNRINAFPCEKISGSYLSEQLKLSNLSHFDFVAFQKPIFNIFSSKSAFSSANFKDINSVISAYCKQLQKLQELPEFSRIINWNWDKPFTSQKIFDEKEYLGKPINIGFLADLSGPADQWGKPGLTGNKLYLDQINSKGGLLVNGVRHPLKMHVFDDKNSIDLAISGAKELVEKHQVKFINGIGGICADAIHPYLTQKKVIYASLISTDIRSDRPYLIAGGDVTPRIDMLRPWYHKHKNSKLKRWAVISQDDPIGRTCQDWEVACAMVEGWEIVHDTHFAQNIDSFKTLVSEILLTRPDIVSLNLTWPEYIPEIAEELYRQGFKGLISANYLNPDDLIGRIPATFIEGAVDSFPLMNDPFWGDFSIQNDFYQSWQDTFGQGGPNNLNRKITGIDWDHLIMLKVWTYGVQLAGSFDPDKILNALRSQKSFPTLLGNAKMSGKAMWGIDNMVSPPIPINEVKNGQKRVQIIKDFDIWFKKRQTRIIENLKRLQNL